MQIFKKTGMVRQSIACLMAIIMLLSLVPVSVFAAETASEETVPSVGEATGKRLSDYDFAPGKYTVTANLVVPGAYNTVLQGVDAYATNSDNPQGTTDDASSLDPSGVTRGNVPSMGVENGATLTIAADGSMSIEVPIPNPVFTIQSIDGCSNATVTGTETVSGSYGFNPATQKTSRISRITVKLEDANIYTWTEKVKDLENLNTTGSNTTVDLRGAIYTFGNCSEYPTLLSMDWNVPLELRIDFTKIPLKAGNWTVATDLSYTGKEQTGVSGDGKGFTISGNTATEAGNYTAVAKLKEGYAWADGSTDSSREISWSIAKAELTASYISETIEYKGTPSLEVEVTGFVNGETAETASAYKAPTVQLPSSLDPGTSYDLKPENGEAKNYFFTYQSGTLTVKHDPKAKPQAATGLVYNGQECIGVPTGDYYVLTGTSSAIDAGSYQATATLKQGFSWPDGSTDPIVIDWTIEKAELVASYVGETIEYDGIPALNVEVTGFVGEENAATASDYKAPTVQAPTSLTPGTSHELTPANGEAKNYYFTYKSGTLTVTYKLQAVPEAANNLVYTGKAQSGVPEAESYEISGTFTATDAGNYQATATLKYGYAWADGSTDSIMINWSIAKAKLTAAYVGETIEYNGTPALKVNVTGFVGGESAGTAKSYTAPTVTAPDSLRPGQTYTITPTGGSAKNYTFEYVSGTLTVKENPQKGDLAPGTYRITANLYVPGKYNKVLGVNAYLTNPDNPLGIGGHEGVPLDPVADNATLVVGEDGSKIIILDVVNPVFTLQQIKDGDNVRVLAYERDDEIYSGNTGVSRNGRITRIWVELLDDSGSYEFKNCIEFPTLLEEDWDVPLILGVDFDSTSKLSDSTDAQLPDTSDTEPENPTNPSNPSKPGDSSNPSNPTNPSKPDVSDNTGNNNSSGSSNEQKTVTVKRLKPGTYTVTCNIWFLKEDSGLPMNPHITSSVFPPKDPVENNATLIVDENGRVQVIIPIAIQSRVMNIHTISGLNIIDYEKNADGYYTSITVDLGVLEDFDTVITKRCNIGLHMGDLAMSISGFDKEQSWPATFQLNLAGVPTVEVTKTVSSTSPQTGDNSNVTVWFAFMALSLGGLLLLTTKKKKYNM